MFSKDDLVSRHASGTNHASLGPQSGCEYAFAVLERYELYRLRWQIAVPSRQPNGHANRRNWGWEGALLSWTMALSLSVVYTGWVLLTTAHNNTTYVTRFFATAINCYYSLLSSFSSWTGRSIQNHHKKRSWTIACCERGRSMPLYRSVIVWLVSSRNNWEIIANTC